MKQCSYEEKAKGANGICYITHNLALLSETEEAPLTMITLLSLLTLLTLPPASTDFTALYPLAVTITRASAVLKES